MRELFATTVPGLEEAAAADLRRGFGLPAEPDRDGGIRLGEPSPEAIVALDRWARSVERIGLLLAEGPVADVEDCYPLAFEPSLEGLIDPDRPFAVRPRRLGEHDFDSPDVGRVVGQAVIDAFRRDRDRSLVVDLDEPDAILRADVDGERFRLWLDATGERPLTERSYRRGWHPAALRTDLAWLLLRLAGWEGEPLVDPMCGSGTIPIEAALAARGVAPAEVRGGRSAWTRLPAFRRSGGSPGSASPGGGDDADATTGSPPASRPLLDPDAAGRFLGVERSTRHLQVAYENVAAAGVEGDVRILGGDARELEELLGDDAGRIDVAVTNPPFGRRSGRPYRVAEVYEGLCDALRRAGVGRAVALAERAEAMGRALERNGYAVRERTPIRMGALDVEVVAATAAG